MGKQVEILVSIPMVSNEFEAVEMKWKDYVPDNITSEEELQEYIVNHVFSNITIDCWEA